MDGEDVRLMLWDTAGQEEFDAITKAYYRGAQACVLAFSTTDRDSFEAIHSWKMKVNILADQMQFQCLRTSLEAREKFKHTDSYSVGEISQLIEEETTVEVKSASVMECP